MAASSKAKSVVETLKRYMKAPWAYTGPQSSPEYKSAVPLATEYRLHCPATITERAAIPTSAPETVYDIKYFVRDQRRNRPPVKRTVLRKADVERIMKEAEFDVGGFPQPYLTKMVEQDYNHVGGGYEKGLPHSGRIADAARYKNL